MIVVYLYTKKYVCLNKALTCIFLYWRKLALIMSLFALMQKNQKIKKEICYPTRSVQMLKQY